jgi:hypothetical protein
MNALSLPRRGLEMKRFTRFGWLWVAALTVVTALSISGCQTGTAWRADGPRDDTAQVSEGGIGDRTCRFG